MPKVLIPSSYRGPTQGAAEVDVSGATVLACLEAVEKQYQGFLAQVIAADGSVHGFVKLFRNGDQLEGDVLAVPLEVGDALEVLAAIAGG